MSKVNQNLVDSVFAQSVGYASDKVLQGPAYGVDCAVISITEKIGMVVASDPLSIIPRIGMKASAYISLHLAANDIATSGLAPQYGQFTLNLPQYMDEEGLQQYWEHIHQFAAQAKINITGGHTSFDAHNNSTLAGGVTLFAVGDIEHIMTSTQAEEGDVLLMTKTAGLTATSILAMVFPNYLCTHLGDEVVQEAASSFWNISVLPESQVVRELHMDSKTVNAMHDVTEGGVMGAVYEFATASRKGIRLDTDKIPVSPVHADVAHIFGLDPQRIIGAGSMLIACKKEGKEMLINELQRRGISCTEIGMFLSESEGKFFTKGDEMYPLNAPAQDAYWSIFAKSMENGLS